MFLIILMSDKTTDHNDQGDQTNSTDPIYELFGVLEERNEEDINPDDLEPYWAAMVTYKDEPIAVDKALLESIQKNGQLERLVINHENQIISGNRRWVILKLLKRKARCRIIKFKD